MAKINTNGKDIIAGGIVYRAGKDGSVDIPDNVAMDEGLADVKNTSKQKPKQHEGIKFLSPQD